jgi:hypothetical protein
MGIGAKAALSPQCFLHLVEGPSLSLSLSLPTMPLLKCASCLGANSWPTSHIALAGLPHGNRRQGCSFSFSSVLPAPCGRPQPLPFALPANHAIAQVRVLSWRQLLVLCAVVWRFAQQFAEQCAPAFMPQHLYKAFDLSPLDRLSLRKAGGHGSYCFAFESLQPEDEHEARPTARHTHHTTPPKRRLSAAPAQQLVRDANRRHMEVPSRGNGKGVMALKQQARGWTCCCCCSTPKA